tara:strand:+ start:784 stop:1221 length:438 start_codon:yes stop_codon:yes gene_type:complete
MERTNFTVEELKQVWIDSYGGYDGVTISEEDFKTTIEFIEMYLADNKFISLDKLKEICYNEFEYSLEIEYPTYVRNLKYIDNKIVKPKNSIQREIFATMSILEDWKCLDGLPENDKLRLIEQLKIISKVSISEYQRQINQIAQEL